MGLMLATLALAAAQPVAEPPVENEIEVIGRKLSEWRSTFNLRKGAFVCKTKRSTGDKVIDALGCDAIRACMTPLIPQWQAINDADLPRKEAQQRFNALMKDNGFHECVFAEREAKIAALAAARRSKRI